MPRYVKCIIMYGSAKIGEIYDTSDNELARRLFSLTWIQVLIDNKRLNERFIGVSNDLIYEIG